MLKLQQSYNSRWSFLVLSEKDFVNVTHDVTFPATEDFGPHTIVVLIPLVDDNINEGHEAFAVILELIDAVDPDRVDLSSRSAVLCRISDNDRKYT